MNTGVARHLTALKRKELSRPIRLALENSVLRANFSLLDYGCGQGDDVRQLQQQGFPCVGWDPFFSQTDSRVAADVVNLGYVVNVIEDSVEREAVLREAWSLTKKVLVVAARLTVDYDAAEEVLYHDGYLTRLGTFQKLFEQNELRLWIDATLGEPSVAAAPGVFYVFRDAELKYAYVGSRVRRVSARPQQRRSDELFERHRSLFDDLIAFVSERGRLPIGEELASAREVTEQLGSIGRAFAIIKRVTDPAQWEKIRSERSQDLLVYMALGRFSKWPKFSILPSSLRLDIRAFYSNYKHACELADRLLFSTGNKEVLATACRSSAVGKLTPTALYLHKNALDSVDPVLRVYEGCAQTLAGKVEGANVIKLHLYEPKVSYLSYPDFETAAHPSLHSSLVVHLRTFELDRRDYSQSENPPILHRKEDFVRKEDASRSRYERLTKQEEAHGLFERTSEIGTRRAWEKLLQDKGLRIQGHRLVRNSKKE
jgi:DNA phosphorothioation-associated putative methyltransferase